MLFFINLIFTRTLEEERVYEKGLFVTALDDSIDSALKSGALINKMGIPNNPLERAKDTQGLK